MPGSARERLLLRTNHLFGCPFTRIPSRGECICPALDDVVAIEAEAREPLARALAESEKRAELGNAWAAAEAALPERHGPLVVETFGDWGGIDHYIAYTYAAQKPSREGRGPTPAAALRALAAALSEPETPR